MNVPYICSCGAEIMYIVDYKQPKKKIKCSFCGKHLDPPVKRITAKDK
ncbi:MAG: hypothetical protein MIO92_01640 [Methanosarcinaceae archaeon]|nr:hypothetical protein [Methanosarcinaceae archaeon]